MLNFRNRIAVELTILLVFAVLHIGLYQNLSKVKPAPAKKSPPVFITLVKPKPKPEPKPEPIPELKKIEPVKKVEPLKPKKITPPKPKKELKKKLKPVIKKVKPIIEKPQRIVEKPKEQQESVIKVHAEEVVEKDIAVKPQQLSEPEVKKPEPEAKPVEKAVEVAPEPEPDPEPVHVPVITKPEYGSSCRSALNRYPAEAREQGIEGTVKIKVKIQADGSIGAVSLVKSSGSDILDNSVLEHVYDCDFEPAQKDDVPISSSVIIPVRFRL